MAVEEIAARNAHILTERLAYELWGRRGHPLGSPEADWFAAEKCLATMLGGSVLPMYGFSQDGTGRGPVSPTNVRSPAVLRIPAMWRAIVNQRKDGFGDM
jgi:hypothetical protein